MADVVCKICGEPRPYRWIGATHCSQYRLERGLAPLKAEHWPPAQAGLIQQQRFIEEATSAGQYITEISCWLPG